MIVKMIVAAFLFRFMAVAVDAIDRRGPSNKMRRQLQPKKPKVRLSILAFYIVAKDVLAFLHY